MPILLLHFSLNRKVFKLGKANPWQVNVLFVSGCDKYHDQRNLVSKKFPLAGYSQSIKRSQGKNSRQELEAETTEEHYLLTCSQTFTPLSFLYKPSHCLYKGYIACTRDTLLVQGMALPIVGRLSSTDMPLGNQMEAITQLRLLLPRSVKLATKINHHS